MSMKWVKKVDDPPIKDTARDLLKKKEKFCRTSLVDMGTNAKIIREMFIFPCISYFLYKMFKKRGRRRSMTPNFFEFHIRMLKVICCAAEVRTCRTGNNRTAPP